MLRHGDLWRGIDRLAEKNRLSVSGLARVAGLDPTTFNKSKRISKEGKPRWPNSESLSRILNSTGESLSSFVILVSASDTPTQARRIPVIGYSQAGGQGYFDDAGYPVGSGWDEVIFPGIADEHTFALEISGQSMEPVYRDADTIVVAPSADIRRGDRVVVKTTAGEVMAKQLARHSARRIELLSINRAHPDRAFDLEDIAWMARIVWVSQ